MSHLFGNDCESIRQDGSADISYFINHKTLPLRLGKRLFDLILATRTQTLSRS